MIVEQSENTFRSLAIFHKLQLAAAEAQEEYVLGTYAHVIIKSRLFDADKKTKKRVKEFLPPSCDSRFA